MKLSEHAFDASPGGATAVFAGFVCGAVLAGLNMKSLSAINTDGFIMLAAAFPLAAALWSFCVSGAWLITLNASVCGAFCALFAYCGYFPGISLPEYLKKLFPLIPAVIGMFCISEFGFISACAISESYRASCPPVKKNGGKAVLACFLTFAALGLYVILLTNKKVTF